MNSRDRERPSFARRLFSRIPIEGQAGRREELRRVLRARDLVAIGLGTMIGGGIFTTIGPGVAKAGPAVIVAFILAGLASLFAALCYAELAAMVPNAGSAYTYAYATLGQVIAWIIGWDLLLEYAISAAPVAQQFSQSAQEALHAGLGLTFPAWAQKAMLVTHAGGIDVAHSHVDVLGAAFVLALTLLLIVGIRETAASNNVFVIIKIFALVVFVIVGLPLFRFANLHDFNPIGWLGHAKDGAPIGIIGSAALVFFTFIGFDAATTTAEETRNPQRDVPIGVIGSLLIGTVIYCCVAVVLVGAVPWQHVSQDTPLQSALAPAHNPFAEWMVRVGVLAGTTSVALVSLLGQTRIFYAMSRDRMLPPFVAKIDPRTRTPALMSAITGVFVALLTLAVPLDILLDIVNIGTMSAFIIVCAGVFWLRLSRPELPRPFKTPFVWVVSISGVLSSLALAIFGLGTITLLRFLVWLVVGLALYFAYGFWHAQPWRRGDPGRGS